MRNGRKLSIKLSARLVAVKGNVMMISIALSVVALPLAWLACVLAASGRAFSNNLPEASCSLCRR